MPMRINPIGIFGSIQLCCQNGMAVSHLSRVGYSGRRKDLSTTEFLQFVIMLCAVANLFYTIGKDIHDEHKKGKKSTKK